MTEKRNMSVIKKTTMKGFLESIIDLREKGTKGLNNDIYTHIKPGQDVIYVRKLRDLINTYLWIK